MTELSSLEQEQALNTVVGDIMFDENDSEWRGITWVNGMRCVVTRESATAHPYDYNIIAEKQDDGSLVVYTEELYDKGYKLTTAKYLIDITGNIEEL